MDALNSRSSRQVSASQNMKQLEKACFQADQRILLRKHANTRAGAILAMGVYAPLATYLLYHFFAPTGVMQNHRAATGAYGHYMQNFLSLPTSQTTIYRPELALTEQGASLAMYSKKIEKKRGTGELPEGVHHPSYWH